MSQVPMVQCTIVARQQDAEALLEALQEAGLVHVTPVDLPGDAQTDLRAGADASPGAAEVRADHGHLQRRLEALQSVSPAPARLQVQDLTYQQVGAQIDELIERRAALLREVERLEAQRDQLAPWGDFEVGDLRALEAAGVAVRFVEMSEDEWPRLDRNQAYALASARDGVHRVLSFDPPESFPGTVVSLPRISLGEVRSRLEDEQRAVRETQRQLGRFAHYAPLFAERLRSLQDRVAVLDALEGAVSAGPIFGLVGFLPRNQVVDLQQALSPFECALRIKDGEKFDERVPVKLDNPAWVSGFETIVETFSGMRYGEKDFTWAVGLLFLAFGSLCLLDAGYGLMLAVLGLVLRARGKGPLGTVFALTGVASLAVGWMSGQFFGLIVGKTVMVESRPLLTLSSNPYHAFLFSLFVGVIAMLFSYSMALWQRGVKTDATGALVLVIAALAAIYANMAVEFTHQLLFGHPPTAEVAAAAKLWANRFAWLCGAAALAAWMAFPGPVFGEKARVGNILWTVYSGTTGFVQDVLSHMRLFGIALSGGIMALVVNEMAARFPLPVTALFAVAGHFFVFLLSLLSLYIHTNRLIFLEWGSKCIDGGTNFYSPLRRNSV